MVPDNFPNLLQSLCIVVKEEGNTEDKQLNIFLIICSLYKKPIHLEIEPQLYRKMIDFLAQQPSTTSV
jgi:hypothetical protein